MSDYNLPPGGPFFARFPVEMRCTNGDCQEQWQAYREEDLGSVTYWRGRDDEGDRCPLCGEEGEEC